MGASDADGFSGPAEPQPAVRLIFEYEGDQVQLRSARRIRTRLAPEPSAQDQGFTAVLRSAEGDVLYRRLMPDPIRRDAEVFPEEPGDPIVRTPVEHPRGAFTVVVPDVAEAEEVALLAPPPERLAAEIEMREIARFPLRARLEERE